MKNYFKLKIRSVTLICICFVISLSILQNTKMVQSAENTCTMIMDAAKNITATFATNLTNFLLTVTKAGTGSGTVTSAPTGINCGSDCTENYTSGTSVTLTAAPASGSTFAGWTGDCSTGQWYSVLQTATKLDQPSGCGSYGYHRCYGSEYGDHPENQVTFRKGDTKYFIIDPYNTPGYSGGNISRVAIIDYMQGGALSAWLIKVDRNGNEISSAQFNFSNNQYIFYGRPLLGENEVYVIKALWSESIPYNYERNGPSETCIASIFWY